MSNVVKLTPKQARAIERMEEEFANFVDDLAGFLWHIRAATHKPFEEIAAECHLSASTLYNLANRITKNPQMRTVWQILRALDDRQIIRHSLLEQYRPLSRETLDAVRSLERKKA